MKYPGRVIKLGEQDARIVKAVRAQLNRMLASPGELKDALDPEATEFDAGMKSAVKLFQTRHTDSQGNPLKPDGELGPISWAALFGAEKAPHVEGTKDKLLARVLEVAAGEEAKEVHEQPPRSNRGPEVDVYLKTVGVPVGNFWCAAFVYWCFEQAARSLGRPNPLFKTAGCLAHWNNAPSKGARRIPGAEATANPALLRPGMIFIMDHGKGLGHTGLVEKVEDGVIVTLEGNANAAGSRDGGGVCRLRRKINSINKGFIDYAGL
jgi:hypothetical protein